MPAARNQEVAVRRPCPRSSPRNSGSTRSQCRLSKVAAMWSRKRLTGSGGCRRIMVGSPVRDDRAMALLPFIMTGEPFCLQALSNGEFQARSRKVQLVYAAGKIENGKNSEIERLGKGNGIPKKALEAWR